MNTDFVELFDKYTKQKYLVFVYSLIEIYINCSSFILFTINLLPSGRRSWACKILLKARSVSLCLPTAYGIH